jgi:Subtilase family
MSRRCSAAVIAAVAALQGFDAGAQNGPGAARWLEPVLQPLTPPRSLPFSLNQQLTHNVPLLSKRYGVTGKGVTVGLWDGGPVLATHLEFGDRVELRVQGVPDDHATHVAGSIGARGYPQKLAIGMAPEARILSFGLANDLQTMEQVFASPAPPQVTNHSYNFPRGWYYSEGADAWCWCGDISVTTHEDYLFGKYTDRSSRIDGLAARFPGVSIFVAAGNSRGSGNDPNTHRGWNGNYYLLSVADPVSATPIPPLNDQHDGGYDTLEGYAVAKNVIAVGAIKDAPVGAIAIAPELVKVTGFSSWGPADDGRVKPDVVANGAKIWSPGVEPSRNGYNRQFYKFLDGTSQATPAASGIGALLTEVSQMKRGKPLRSDEMKVVLIHTAVSPHDGPSYQVGWGAIDADKAGALIAGDDGVLIAGALAQGTPFRLLTEKVGGGPVRLSVAWIDPPAPENRGGLNDRTRTLVHDLDLSLVGPDGTRHYPWSLDPSNPGNPATRCGPNNVDNVERIDVAAPVAAGDWTIEVTGPAAGIDQRFALAITGLKPKGVDDPSGNTPETGKRL